MTAAAGIGTSGTIIDTGGSTDTYSNIQYFGGSSRNDSFTGNTAAETFVGYAGDDVFNGGGGIDTVDYRSENFFAGPGSSGIIVNLSATDFTLTASNVLAGHARDATGGNDTLIAIENVIGTFHDDILIGNAGNNRLDGRGGDDLSSGGQGNDVLVGGSQAQNGDTVSYFLDSTTGVKVDLAIAIAQNTVGAGIDAIMGFENLGGSGFADTLTGDAGANHITGAQGNDIIFGRGGADHIEGEEGDDIINGGAGADTLRGGLNTVAGDTVSYAGSLGVNVDLNIQNGTSAQVSAGDASGDILSGFENVLGSSLADKLMGDGGDNVLMGGAGNDTLTGGLGADTFVFNTALNALTNKDTIVDFVSGMDHIELDNAIFTGLGLATGTLSAVAFALSTDIAAADDRIIYNVTTGALIYDSNGSAAGGQTVFAVLTGHPTLTASDFQIIRSRHRRLRTESANFLCSWVTVLWSAATCPNSRGCATDLRQRGAFLAERFSVTVRRAPLSSAHSPSPLHRWQG